MKKPGVLFCTLLPSDIFDVRKRPENDKPQYWHGFRLCKDRFFKNDELPSVTACCVICLLNLLTFDS